MSLPAAAESDASPAVDPAGSGYDDLLARSAVNKQRIWAWCRAATLGYAIAFSRLGPMTWATLGRIFTFAVTAAAFRIAYEYVRTLWAVFRRTRERRQA